MIIFKSTPENFKKEKSGLKRNTVRKIDFEDERFSRLTALQDAKRMGYDVTFGSVYIQNTQTGQTFKRELTDITYFDGYLILSW